MPFNIEAARRLVIKMTRQLTTYARWASTVWQIKVSASDEQDSWTDCKSCINVGFAADWLLTTITTVEEWQGALLGLLEHEVAHILYSSTSKKELEAYQTMAREAGIPYKMAMDLRAMLEDGRVNYSHANRSPQAIRTLQWVCEVHYRHEAKRFTPECVSLVEQQTFLNLIMASLLQRARCGKDLPYLPERVLEVLEEIDPYIEKGIRETTTWDMLENAAIPIGKIIAKDFPLPTQQDLGTGQHDEKHDLNGQGKKGGGNTDTRLNPKSNTPIDKAPGKGEKTTGKKKPKHGGKENEPTIPNKQDNSPFKEFLKKLRKGPDESGVANDNQLPNPADARHGLGPSYISKMLNIEHVVFEEIVADFNPEGYEEALKVAEPYIEPWIEGLQTRLERKRSSMMSGARYGRIDPKRMYRATAFLDPRIFKLRDRIESFDIAGYILCDNSGSMYGERIEMARAGSLVLAHGLNYLNIPFVVVGYMATTEKIDDLSTCVVQHIRYTEWDYPDMERIGSMDPDHCNRDGYSIRIATAELKQRYEKQKLLMVLSDGMPVEYSADEDGVLDTAQAVEEAQEAGIQIVALYFGTTEPEQLETLNKMYGEDNVVIVRQLNDLITDMVDVLDETLKG